MAMNENQLGRWEAALDMLDSLEQKLHCIQYEPLVARGDLLHTPAFSQAVEAYTQALARIPVIEGYHWPIYFARGVCRERQQLWEGRHART